MTIKRLFIKSHSFLNFDINCKDFRSGLQSVFGNHLVQFGASERVRESFDQAMKCLLSAVMLKSNLYTLV